jgi:hypothetical protein
LRRCAFSAFRRLEVQEDKEPGRIFSQESRNLEKPERYVGSEQREERQGKRACAQILLKACARGEKGDLWICLKGSSKSPKSYFGPEGMI